MNINENMTLAECLEYIRHELKYFDNPNLDTVGIEESLGRIEELTRWIPVEERLPTLDDSTGFIDHDARTCATVLAVDKINYSPRCVNFRNVTKENGYSHWRRIETSPPLTINDVKEAWAK